MTSPILRVAVAATWPVLVVAAGAGTVVGVAVRRWLRRAAYRLEEESHLAARPLWWLVPGAALVFAALAWRFATTDLWPYLVAALPAAAAGLALTAIDVDVHRLPERLTVPSYAVLPVLLAVASALTADWTALSRAVLAGAASWLGYFLLAYLAAVVSPGGLGFGDVMLAGLIGMLCGWLGWTEALLAAVAAFVVSGLVAMALLAARRVTRTSHIAFGPFMVAGALIAMILSPAGLPAA